MAQRPLALADSHNVSTDAASELCRNIALRGFAASDCVNQGQGLVILFAHGLPSLKRLAPILTLPFVARICPLLRDRIVGLRVSIPRAMRYPKPIDAKNRVEGAMYAAKDDTWILEG